MKPTKFSFTDNELRLATKITRQRMLDSLPSPEDCHYDVSPELKEKIEKIIAKDCRRTAIQKFTKQVAMVALCILLGLGSWLAVDAEARAAFIQWAREVYEESIIYRYFNQSDSIELPNYEISSLPDGYQEIDRVHDDYTSTTVYINGEQILIFSYQKMMEGSSLQILSSDYIHEDVQVAGKTGDFYSATLEDDTNELIWIDEDVQIAFQISAWMNKEDMLAIATNIVLHQP